MLCISDCFTYEFAHFGYISCKLVNYPGEDLDSSRNVSVMNNKFRMRAFVGFVV